MLKQARKKKAPKDKGAHGKSRPKKKKVARWRGAHLSRREQHWRVGAAGNALEDSLLEYIKAEELSGVECSHCNAKHDATRQMALLTLPPVLTLQLLRFVYDLATGSKKRCTMLSGTGKASGGGGAVATATRL